MLSLNYSSIFKSYPELGVEAATEGLILSVSQSTPPGLSLVRGQPLLASDWLLRASTVLTLCLCQ